VPNSCDEYCKDADCSDDNCHALHDGDDGEGDGEGDDEKSAASGPTGGSSLSIDVSAPCYGHNAPLTVIHNAQTTFDAKSWACAPCDVKCNSAKQWEQHLSGDRHKAAAAKTAAATKSEEKKTYRCELCGKTCNSAKQWEQHLNGFTHKDTVAAASAPATAVSAEFKTPAKDSSEKASVAAPDAPTKALPSAESVATASPDTPLKPLRLDFSSIDAASPLATVAMSDGDASASASASVSSLTVTG
jgi:hypothetical protein